MDRFLNLPKAPDIERAVIGAVLMDRQAVEIATEFLIPEDFADMRHRLIWKSVLALSLEPDGQVDEMTVKDALRRHGDLATVSPEYVEGCPDATSTTANIDAHVAIVREKALLRRLIEGAERAALQGRQPGMTSEDMLETLDAQMGQVVARLHRQEPEPLRVLVPPVAAALEERLKHRDALNGIPTGYHRLDQLTGGLQPEFIVLAAKTSIGKTAFAVGLLRHVGVTLKIPCAMFSIEMTHQEIIHRLVAAEGKVSLHDMRNGWLSERDQCRMRTALTTITEAPIYIDDTSTLSLAALRVKLRRLIRRRGVTLAVVDYLQLIQPPTAESRHEEVALVSRGLKALAKELQIPILVLSQLTRASGNEVPSLGDLRGSGEIEESAPTVLFLHRERNRENHELPAATKLLLSKQRNGPLGCVDLYFENRWAAFQEPAPAGYQEMDR